MAREELLGQFDIGLLSAFMVTDDIASVLRSARDPRASRRLVRDHRALTPTALPRPARMSAGPSTVSMSIASPSEVTAR